MAPDPHDHDHDHDHDHAAPAVDRATYEGVQGWILRSPSPTERELVAVIDAARLDGSVDKAASQLARRVTLKGFRPGKAPVARVKALHGDDIRRDALQDLVREVWEEAAKAKQLRPVGNPAIVDLSAEPGESVRFTLRMEVLPEVKLENLAALKVSDKSVKVSDKDVDEEMGRLRELAAEFVPAAHDTVSAGDFALIDLAQFAPGANVSSAEPAETKEGAMFEVGNDKNMPELDQAVLGMAVSEARTFTARFAAEHPNPDYAGKESPFRVTLREIRTRRLPELDASFFARIGHAGTAEELRSLARQRLIDSRTARARGEQEHEILGQLLSLHAFELPKSLVDTEAEARIRKGLEGLARQGVDVRTAKIDWETEFKRARETADRDLRIEYLLELVATERGIKVEAADVNAEIADIARRQRMSPSSLRSELEKNGQMPNLEGTLRRRRALDSLRSGARIQVE